MKTFLYHELRFDVETLIIATSNGILSYVSQLRFDVETLIIATQAGESGCGK